ncbi:MAG: hypothetical protein ACRD3E_02795 [Terriglobales bacterium]
MNIDERLEALTQTVELLTLDVRELQDSTNKFQGSVETFVAEQHETNKRMVESIAGLVRVAQIHENRLTHLEGTAD